jgi:hypothetical protein
MWFLDIFVLVSPLHGTYMMCAACAPMCGIQMAECSPTLLVACMSGLAAAPAAPPRVWEEAALERVRVVGPSLQLQVGAVWLVLMACIGHRIMNI